MDIFMEYIKAFMVGGLICAAGQVLINYTKLTPARILVAYVVLGVVLGSLGVYDKIIEFAGAGATVPIIGFGNSIADGTLKAIREKGVIGILTGGITATAAGISAAIFFGLCAALIFKPRDKS